MRRLIATLPVMVVVGLFVFSLLYLAPGDPAALDRRRSRDGRRHRQDPRRSSASTSLSWFASPDGHGTCCTAISVFRSSPISRSRRLIGQRIEPTLALARPPCCSLSHSRCQWASSQPGRRGLGLTAPSWASPCSASLPGLRVSLSPDLRLLDPARVASGRRLQ